MRIAHLIVDARDDQSRFEDPVPEFGPAAAAVLAGLVRQPGLELHVVSCAHRPAAAPPRLPGGIHYHQVVVPAWGWLRSGYAGCVRAVLRQLAIIQPDIVHGQGTERWCALAAVFSGRPNVVTVHGHMQQIARVVGARPFGYHWLAARLEPLALRRTGGVFCNSAHTEFLVRAQARRVWRVPNALRDGLFIPGRAAPAPVRPPRLVNVGAVREIKQQLELLAALEPLLAAGIQFRLEFAGRIAPTEYGRKFQARIERAGAQGWATHVGELSSDNLVRWLDESAALVHVSTEESFGLAVAEGLARNLKFFGFGVGGVPDVAAEAEGAELFPVGDWRGLTGALTRWLTSGAPRPMRAAEAMRARFQADVVAARHIEIYREVLASRAAVSGERSG